MSSGMSMEAPDPAASRAVDLPDVASAEALGRALAAALPLGPGLVLHLQGELGAGKTTLARALLRALGVTGPVRSPTYTLIERYPMAAGECAHLDLYRIADPEEMEFLGLDDLAGARLMLVEWPQRGASAVPAADLTLSLTIAGTGRRAVLQAGSGPGLAWLRGVDGA
jgi:tRNA threonylcarbamoyladenosine biosynthesis protein TsaE